MVLARRQNINRLWLSSATSRQGPQRTLPCAAKELCMTQVDCPSKERYALSVTLQNRGATMHHFVMRRDL